MENANSHGAETRPTIEKRLFDSLCRELVVSCSKCEYGNITPDEFILQAEAIFISMKALRIAGPAEWIYLYTKAQFGTITRKNVGPDERVSVNLEGKPASGGLRRDRTGAGRDK